MNRFKLWTARHFFKEFFTESNTTSAIADASGSRESVSGLVGKIGLSTGTSNGEFEEPDFDLNAIYNGYNTDSYIRQGVDKYVDQIFKEGYDFYGKDTAVVDYIKLRLAYIAEATNTPTNQLLIDITEDMVKYGNSIIAKARAKDSNVLPPSTKVTGLNGSQPIAGYFCLNVPSMSVKRDKFGMVKTWQQEVNSGKKKFKSDDIIHMYYKKEKGSAFGTSLLIPVLDDVRALRQAEENVLRMMYRNIYPFYHMAVGEKDAPGTEAEITELENSVSNMDVEGGLITSNRVVIKPIASDQVINAEPYLRYLEDRIFSGMGIPAIMFGRGDTANRSTGDNMKSEMSDRITAYQRTMETFINTFIIKDLLMEGGYDPVLNPDQAVFFKFKENDLDTKIKAETNAIYQYEHNAITEDEMRTLLGRDPITDRGRLYQSLITQANAEHQSSLSNNKSDTETSSKKNSEKSGGTKETNNKQKPTNQHGTKTSPKKMTNSEQLHIGLVKDDISVLDENLKTIILDCQKDNASIDKKKIEEMIDYSRRNINAVISVVLDDINDIGNKETQIKAIYDQFKDDINYSLYEVDYSDAIGLIDTITDLIQERLIKVI
jgi:hypothetical protein